MKRLLKLFKLLSDEKRLRILMILTKKEMCVCQIMAVIGASQPLISRNLAMLKDAGLVLERRKGKLRYYRLDENMPEEVKDIVRAVKKALNKDRTFINDLKILRECDEFQRLTGRCDMKTFEEFMKTRRKDATEGDVHNNLNFAS